MLVFQGPVPVVDNYQWSHIGGFTAVLESNNRRSNYGVMIIKDYHCVLKPWLLKINVSARSERRSLLIFDGYPSYLNLDILKDLGVDGMVVLLRMTNT